jgi:ATP-dependent DNA helicase RecQ
VREEIVERLGLHDPAVFVRGFDRPSLWLEVQTCLSEREKVERLLAAMPRVSFPGIVYVATRKQTGEIAELLASESGLRTAAYHGGMAKAERHEAQERFMSGDLDVIVATTAFGMGIDKADVRFVVHYDIPESVDAYYQEAGRAGRDGQPALALLLWRQEDLGLRKFFANAGQLDVDEVERVAIVLRAAVDPVPLTDLREALDMSETRFGQVITRLEDAGAVTLHGDSVQAVADGPPPAVAARQALAAQEARTAMDESRLAMMRAYTETRGCRRRFILTYFGEPAAEQCFTCDRCVADAARGFGDVDVRDDTGPFPEQSRVRHRTWGDGLVLRHDGDAVVILFDDVGYKTLSVDLVTQHGLLEPA